MDIETAIYDAFDEAIEAGAPRSETRAIGVSLVNKIAAPQ